MAAAQSRVRARVTWPRRDQWGETLLIGNTLDHWLVIGAGLSISGGGRLISQSQPEVSDWSANSGPRSGCSLPRKFPTHQCSHSIYWFSALASERQDNGKRSHPLLCLTAPLENFRRGTRFLTIVRLLTVVNKCLRSWSCHRDVFPVLYNPIIKVPDSTLSGIDWSQSCHYCGRGPALSLPPRSLSTKLDGTWKWYWGQSCQSRYCNTHHESSCPLTIYFCIIPLSVCIGVEWGVWWEGCQGI